MSCRVLKREVEYFVINQIIEELLHEKITNLTGEYLETLKNHLVSDLLDKLSFDKFNENKYKIEIKNFKPFKHNILCKNISTN